LYRHTFRAFFLKILKEEAKMIRKLLFAYVFLALIVSACAGTATPTEEPDGGPPEDEFVEITILAEDIPAGLDGDGPSAAIPTSQTGMYNLLEPLVYYELDGTNADGVHLWDFNNFEGRLAESFEFDEDTLTWTFHLREDVVGCEGQTFNADDVVYTFARAKSVSGAAPIGWFLSNVSSIDNFTVDVFAGETELGDEVVKVDEYTVQIRQSAFNKLFLPTLGPWVLNPIDKETMEAHATEEDPWSHEWNNNENLPGFGPYCIESWVKDEEFIVTANPNYYRGAPAIDRIVYKKVPQSSNRVAAIRSGEAQLVEHLTPKEFNALRNTDGVEVAGVFGNENLFVHMNFLSPPFDNILVRQAVAYAIPYDEIIETGYFGNAKKWEGQVPSSYPGFHRSDIQYTYDPEKAKELLADAGYPEGAGLEEFAENFKLAYVSEKESTLGPIATIIQTALRDVGMPVELDPLPQTQYGDRQLVKKDLPLALNDQEKPIVVDAGYAMLLFFVSAEAGGLNNMVNYANPELDALFAEMLVETDEPTRNEMLAEMQDLLQRDVAWLPVVEWQTQWAFSPDLQGITWHPDNSLRWVDLSAK
jgi:peptide/nickel transport system substrate-binding protein